MLIFPPSIKRWEKICSFSPYKKKEVFFSPQNRMLFFTTKKDNIFLTTKKNVFFSPQFLPIPELMPLRLTRQIRNLLKPLREKGLIEGTMVHALRALRNNSDLLLATMDVFIKEPSLDWQVRRASPSNFFY